MASTKQGTPLVYRHSSKAEWGLAMVAWEKDDRRAYQFEDGVLRVFKQGHYDRLEEVDATADRIAALVAMVGDGSPSPGPEDAAGQPPRSITLDEQVAQFFAAYPRGFKDPAWRAQHRRHDKRALKCHREPAIAAAHSQLSHVSLDSLRRGGREHEAVEALCRVLSCSDIIAGAQIKRLAEMRGPVAQAIGVALRELLWGTGAFADRFGTWVEALASGCGRPPIWELATAPLALVHPDEHVCIKPTRFRIQATWMAPSLRLGSPPQAAAYTRALAMAQLIRQQIQQRGVAGAEAADLFDIHDFIDFTLGAKASAAIVASRARAPKLPHAPPASG